MFRKGTIHQTVAATFETEGLHITFESYQSETDEITGTAWIHQGDRSYLGDAKLWYKLHEGSAQIKLFIQEFQEGKFRHITHEWMITDIEFDQNYEYKLFLLFSILFTVIYLWSLFQESIKTLKEKSNLFKLLTFVLVSINLYIVIKIENFVLSELSPLQMNGCFFLILSLISSLIIMIIEDFSEGIFYKIDVRIKNSDNFTYAYFQVLISLLLNGVISIIPKDFHYFIKFLNFRVIIIFAVLNMSFKMIHIMLFKQRKLAEMEADIYIIYVDLAVYAVSRYSVEMLITDFANGSFAVAVMIISFMLTFLKLQHMYGTRFFLPNRCREKKHDYWRNIQQDFDYTKIDPLQTPEGSYCLEKLHVSPLSVIANCDISATKIGYLRIAKG